MQGFIAAVTTLLIAAKGHGHIAVVVVVDEDGTSFQAAAQAVRAGEVARPYRRAKAVLAVVGKL